MLLSNITESENMPVKVRLKISFFFTKPIELKQEFGAK
jgi:hypothetical protein